MGFRKIKFRLAELDVNGEVTKVYYISPNIFNKEDFNELKKKCIKKYASELDFRNIFSKRKFEIHTTTDNVLWRYHSNPIRDYYNMI